VICYNTVMGRAVCIPRADNQMYGTSFLSLLRDLQAFEILLDLPSCNFIVAECLG